MVVVAEVLTRSAVWWCREGVRGEGGGGAKVAVLVMRKSRMELVIKART